LGRKSMTCEKTVWPLFMAWFLSGFSRQGTIKPYFWQIQIDPFFFCQYI
jgi:hypothetical protein